MMTLDKLRQIVKAAVYWRGRQGFSFTDDVESRAVAASIWVSHDQEALIDAISNAIGECETNLRFPWAGAKTLRSVQVSR